MMKISNRKKRKIRKKGRFKLPTIWSISNKELVAAKILTMIFQNLVDDELEERKKKLEEKKEQ